MSSAGDSDPAGNLACVTPARFRAVPSIAHRLALVAAGEAAAAVSLHWPSAWDYAAGHALLRGAGATLLDEQGREVAYERRREKPMRVRLRRPGGGRPRVPVATVAHARDERAGPRGRGLPGEAAEGSGGDRRGASRAGPGLPPGPDGGRQPGSAGGVRRRGGHPPEPPGRPAPPRGRGSLEHPRRPADRRFRDGPRARPVDPGARPVRARGGARGLPRVAALVAFRRGRNGRSGPARPPEPRKPGQRLGDAGGPSRDPRARARPRARRGARPPGQQPDPPEPGVRGRGRRVRRGGGPRDP